MTVLHGPGAAMDFGALKTAGPGWRSGAFSGSVQFKSGTWLPMQNTTVAYATEPPLDTPEAYVSSKSLGIQH